MIVIHMPGGGIRYIERDELLWFRKAFGSEWKGAVVLQLSTDRVYSMESVDDLVSKFTDAQVPVVQLTPPDTRLKLYVDADNVRQVDESNPIIYHKKAKSVLLFSGKIRLAVREEVKEATSLLENARSNADGLQPVF